MMSNVWYQLVQLLSDSENGLCNSRFCRSMSADAISANRVPLYGVTAVDHSLIVIFSM